MIKHAKRTSTEVHKLEFKRKTQAVSVSPSHHKESKWLRTSEFPSEREDALSLVSALLSPFFLIYFRLLLLFLFEMLFSRRAVVSCRLDSKLSWWWFVAFQGYATRPPTRTRPSKPSPDVASSSGREASRYMAIFSLKE